MMLFQVLTDARVTLLHLLQVQVFLCLINWSVSSSLDDESKKVVCYYGSWSHWRSYPGQLSPDSIDPHLCTHIIYSFAKIDPESFEITAADETLDLNENTWSVDGYKKFTSLKNLNPSLKTQISVGGWNEGSRIFSNLVHNDTAVDVFIKSVKLFLDKFSFDGIDIDWEYPGQRDNSRSTDSIKLSLLLQKLRSTLQSDKYIISIAVPGSQYLAQYIYPSDSIFDFVDHVHLMTYDYYGPWTYVVGHTAPLFSRSSDDSRSINSSLTYWLTRVSSDKLLLGISLYGRTFKLTDSSKFTPLSLSQGEGVTGSISKIPGVLSYYESCSFVDNPDTVKIWDFLWSTPYAVNQDQWISLEDKISIQAKATFIKIHDIAGAVIWSLDHDDITGIICHQGKLNNRKQYKSRGKAFPLTSIISQTLLTPVIDSVNIPQVPTTPNTRVILVSDLNNQDDNCSIDCEFTQFDSELDQLNTQSNELIVTNVTFNNFTALNTANCLCKFNHIHQLVLLMLVSIFYSSPV